MRIVSFRNSDLERLWPGDEMRNLARQYEAKLRAMLTAIEQAQNVAELATPPGRRVLKARRKGIWSLTVDKQSSADFPDRRLRSQRDRL
jgi:plasmid maintenance system killer protein